MLSIVAVEDYLWLLYSETLFKVFGTDRFKLWIMVQLDAPESLLQSVKITTAVFDCHLTDALHCAISMLEVLMTVNKRVGDMNCLDFFTGTIALLLYLSQCSYSQVHFYLP
jgi:hypothetical protein